MLEVAVIPEVAAQGLANMVGVGLLGHRGVKVGRCKGAGAPRMAVAANSLLVLELHPHRRASPGLWATSSWQPAPIAQSLASEIQSDSGSFA